MKKMLFIYNPNAGTGVLKPKLSDVLDIFVKAGYEVTVYPTQCYHDAMAKAESYTESYDVVVCSGGDGTLDEVVTAMARRKDPVPIGYIPTGTTNDFANSLHISKDLLEAADTAANGVPFPCDVGVFNDDYFVYIAAFGLFTLTREVPANFPSRILISTSLPPEMILASGCSFSNLTASFTLSA